MKLHLNSLYSLMDNAYQNVLATIMLKNFNVINVILNVLNAQTEVLNAWNALKECICKVTHVWISVDQMLNIKMIQLLPVISAKLLVLHVREVLRIAPLVWRLALKPSSTWTNVSKPVLWTWLCYKIHNVLIVHLIVRLALDCHQYAHHVIGYRS